MFSSNDYDGKEDYRRDREKRLAEMDSLNQKAQNDFNDSFFNREAIFEREREETFEAPKEKVEKETYHEMTKVDSEYDYYDDEDNDSLKNAIISLLAVGAVGTLGYFGYSYIQNGAGGNVSNTPATTVATSDSRDDSVQGNLSGESKGENAQTTSKEESISAKDKQEIASKIAPAISSAVVSNISSSQGDSIKQGDREAQPAIEKQTQHVVAKAPNGEGGVDRGSESSTIAKNSETSPKVADESVKLEEQRAREAQQSKMVKEVIKRLKEKKEQDSAKAVDTEPPKVALVKQPKRDEVVKETPKKTKQKKRTKYRVVTIKKGDTLASLAERYYGNPMYYKPIIRANRDIRSSRSRLRIGQKVIIPSLDKAKKGRRMVRVRKGDTLASIAKRYYGSSTKYQKIIDANYKIKNKHTRLHIGQLIYVP